MVELAAIADQARKHLGEPGPLNTCMSNGPEEWTRELGIPTLGTASVTEGVRRAQAGHNGYRYHDGTDGLARGHIGVWTHQALGGDQYEHVTVVDDVRGNLWRGIGSGTPSGKVAYQPQSGGYNPRSVLRGYIIPPTSSSAPAKPAAAKPAAKPTPAGTYTVKRGDTLIKIATRNKVSGGYKAILKANPNDGHGTRDYHIVRANYIRVGQKLHLP